MTTDDIETHEKAVLLGLWTGAYIAKKVDWPLSEFIRAALMAWHHERTEPKLAAGVPREAPPR